LIAAAGLKTLAFQNLNKMIFFFFEATEGQTFDKAAR